MSPPAICCGTTPTFCMILPAKPPSLNFRPLRSSILVIGLRNQPPIWQLVLPHGNEVDVVALEELVQHILPATMEQPRILHARVHSERHGGGEHERVVLAEVVVERRVAGLDGAVLDGVEHLERGNDLAGGKDLDLELVVGQRGDALGDVLGAAVQRVERLGPAGRHPPLHLGHRLGDGGSRDSGRGGAEAGDADALEEFTSCDFSHSILLELEGFSTGHFAFQNGGL